MFDRVSCGAEAFIEFGHKLLCMVCLTIFSAEVSKRMENDVFYLSFIRHPFDVFERLSKDTTTVFADVARLDLHK